MYINPSPPHINSASKPLRIGSATPPMYQQSPLTRNTTNFHIYHARVPTRENLYLLLGAARPTVHAFIHSM